MLQLGVMMPKNLQYVQIANQPFAFNAPKIVIGVLILVIRVVLNLKIYVQHVTKGYVIIALVCV